MFTFLFLAALMLMVLTKLWLAARQVRHVAQHRHAVPERFADTITLSSHQKAADYTIARTRLSMLEVLAGAALLIVLTMLGGLQWINQFWIDTFGPGYAYSVALIASVAVIGAWSTCPSRSTGSSASSSALASTAWAGSSTWPICSR